MASSDRISWNTNTQTPDLSLAEQVAETALRHPAVSRLDADPAMASYLPGKKVIGVRTGGPGEPVELGVVLRLDRPLPEVLAELRAQVQEVTGPVPVNITVADVVRDGS